MLGVLFDGHKGFTAGSPAIPGLVALLILASIVFHFLKRPQRPNLSSITPAPGSHSYVDALKECFSKYSETPFILETSPPLVILPAACVNEAKSLPENKASMMDEVKRVFLGPIKNDLTRHIANVLDGLQDEVRYSLDREFGAADDWTAQPVYKKFTNIVALLSGRVFVGMPLSREKEWLDITISYTIQCVKTRDACNRVHPLLRRLICPFLPEVKDLQAQRVRGAELLKPILDEILEREDKGLPKPDVDEFEDEQGTFCSWMLKYADKKERRNALRLSNNQMDPMHTTSMALSQVIFDLAARPEYVKPLREEIQETVAEHGEDNDLECFAKLKKTSFTKLKKLDSFLKESQRLNPPEIISMTRVSTSPITLSTGQTLPTGTRFAFPSFAIHTSPKTTAFSPAYNPPEYSPPLEFDGMRFYKLRNMLGKENKHQFVTTAPDSITFGHGTHACPGRFFASNEIKVVLVELLKNWEMRLKDGKRPENLMHGFACIPNMSAEVEFRRLKN